MIDYEEPVGDPIEATEGPTIKRQNLSQRFAVFEATILSLFHPILVTTISFKANSWFSWMNSIAARTNMYERDICKALEPGDDLHVCTSG